MDYNRVELVSQQSVISFIHSNIPSCIFLSDTYLLSTKS